MPTSITAANAQPSTTYKLREFHGKCPGVQLWAWDTESAVTGIENDRGKIATQSVTDQESLAFALESPPATLFTLSVSSYQPHSAAASGVPTPVVFELLAGHGRAAGRVLTVRWTPNEFLTGNNQAWILQFEGILASSWWVFARLDGVNPPQCDLTYKCLLSRGVVVQPFDTRVGPDVVVVP